MRAHLYTGYVVAHRLTGGNWVYVSYSPLCGDIVDEIVAILRERSDVREVRIIRTIHKDRLQAIDHLRHLTRK